MSLLAKSKGEVTYKDLTGFHKWFLIVLVSMGSSIIYTPIYLKNVFYEPLMQGLGCTNADLGALLSCYAIVAVITYLPAGIIADKVRMRTLSWVGFGATAVLTFIYAMLPSIQMLYVVFVGYGITTILIWWGTRFKIVRLCCSEDDYASKIGVSYSIYGVAGLVIGLSLTLVHILGIHFTGTSVNPARSFGPALFAGGDALANVWVFVVAPLVGGVLAALVWKFLHSGKDEA